MTARTSPTPRLCCLVRVSQSKLLPPWNRSRLSRSFTSPLRRKVFPTTTPEVTKTAAGMEQRAVAQDSTRTKGAAKQLTPSIAHSKTSKNTRRVKSVCCTFFKQKRRFSPYFKFKCSSALSKEGYRNKFACWPNKGVHRELGHINTRSVGLTDGAGISATLGISTTSKVSSTTNTAVGGAVRPGINRDTVYVEQRGCECSSPPSEGVCLPDLSSPQEGRWLSTSGELESTEQVHYGGALQDGGLP